MNPPHFLIRKRRYELSRSGECLRHTLQALEHGSQSDSALSAVALQAATRQAKYLTRDITNAFKQSDLQAADPTGLLYGRIQSGKTLIMIITSAMLIDHGWRVIVVLTSNNVRLVEQTADRFRVLSGPLVFSSSANEGGEYQWVADQELIRRRIGSHGVVFVCAKDPRHQRALIRFLDELGAAEYPALIFDDEADHATLDTTLRARSAQKPSAPVHPSTTYRLTVENNAPDELGASLRQVLPRHVFVQVTATPFALLLQNSDSPLRPAFARLIEPGPGYCGGEAFFEDDSSLSENQPPLCCVDEDEVTRSLREEGGMPQGLARSVAFFLLACAARVEDSTAFPGEGYKHLSHTSPRTDEHERVAFLIRRYIDAIAAALDADVTQVTTWREIIWAYDELGRTRPQLSCLDALLSIVQRHLHLRRVVTINGNGSRSGSEYGPTFNFIVGGNILGRGLTIENLLVTYYQRRARSSQMDTVLQHARMYGYRRGFMQDTRVFLPRRMAEVFRHIHKSETELRYLLKLQRSARPVPIRIIDSVRPTRPGVLDHEYLGVFRPGTQVYPHYPVHQAELLGDSTTRIDAMVRSLMGGKRRDNEFVMVPTKSLIPIIESVVVSDDDAERWNAAALSQLLLSLVAEFPFGDLYTRDFQRGGEGFIKAGLSGDELRIAKRRGRPVLAILRESGAHEPWSGAPFWYPIIVFPMSMATQVINTSE